MKQLEEAINDLYQNNSRKIHQMCNKRLRRFGGLEQKDYDDFYSAANEACIYGFREYKEGIIILAEVKGYYDGVKIVVDEEERKNLNAGDEVIITILGKINSQKTETREEKRKRIIDLDKYIISTGRTAEEIDEYIREMRDNDRY